MCRLDEHSTAAAPAPAACIIRLDNKLLAISTDDGSWQLPVGKAAPDQSAQCTAHQAVWQHTGLNVEVGQKLGETPNHTHIYNCLLTSGFDGNTNQLPVPAWAQYKVVKIGLLNPFETAPSDWSDNIDLIELRAWFNQIK